MTYTDRANISMFKPSRLNDDASKLPGKPIVLFLFLCPNVPCVEYDVVSRNR